MPTGRGHAWHVYTVLVNQADRDDVVAELRTKGIEAGIYYPRLVWDHAVYRDHDLVAQDATPVAADTTLRCISLPVFDGLADEQLQRIATTVSTALTR